MNKHTPGPWKRSAGSVVIGPLGVTVVYCSENAIFGSKGSYSITKNEAIGNAKLIAAAPDLLEALEELDNHICNNLETNYPTGIDVNDSAFQKARVALAKARGES